MQERIDFFQKILLSCVLFYITKSVLYGTILDFANVLSNKRIIVDLHFYTRGKYNDCHVMGLLRDDWINQQK